MGAVPINNRLPRLLLTLAVALLLVACGSPGSAQIGLQPGPETTVTQAPKYIAAADFNADGALDVVVTNQVTNRMTVLFGNNGSSFDRALNFDAGRVLRSVVAGDLNGDGCADVATTDYLDSRVYYTFGETSSSGACNGTFGQIQSTKVGARPVDLMIGNFTASPGLELAVASTGRIEVLGQSAPNGLIDVILASEYQGARRAIAVDLDGDSFDDVVTLRPQGAPIDRVSVFLNGGAGAFRFVGSALADPGALDVVSADLNLDGTPDLVVLSGGVTAAPNQYSATILLNRPELRDGKIVGSAAFDPQPLLKISCPAVLNRPPMRCFPHSILAADLGRDSFPDLVVSFHTLPADGSSVQTPGLLPPCRVHTPFRSFARPGVLATAITMGR